MPACLNMCVPVPVMHVCVCSCMQHVRVQACLSASNAHVCEIPVHKMATGTQARTTIWSKLSQSSLTAKDTKTGIVILFHWTEQKRQVVQGEKAFSIQFTHCYLFPLAAWWLGQPEDLHWPVAILSNWILKSGTRKTNPRRRVIIEHMYQANYWTVTFVPLLNYRKLRKEIVKLFLMCN